MRSSGVKVKAVAALMPSNSVVTSNPLGTSAAREFGTRKPNPKHPQRRVTPTESNPMENDFVPFDG